MSSEEVLLLNAILYTVTLFYFYFKYKLSVGVFIWILYTLSAWSSFLFVQQPLYASSAHASTQTLLPCFYLYVIFVIAMTPLMKLNKIESIDSLNHRLLIAIMVVCSLIQVLFFIVDIPAMLNVMRSGSGMLSELRSTVYGDDGLSAITKNVWLNKISLLYSGIRIFATGLSVIMFIAYNKHRRLVTIFPVSALLNRMPSKLLIGSPKYLYMKKAALSPNLDKVIAAKKVPPINITGIDSITTLRLLSALSQSLMR